MRFPDPPAHSFHKDYVARPGDIDELGHVNNAVWVQWMQDISVDHWKAVAPPADDAAYFWVIVRHEIDYLRALLPGQRVTAHTWVADEPKGARFDRLIAFLGDDGKAHVRARTSWAIIDRATQRPIRVPAHMVALFR